MRWLRELTATAAAVTCALALTATARADVRLQQVGTFDNPVHVAGAPGDGERLYVVEQGGVVKVWRGGTATVFADLRSVVQYGGEEGLLSIAFAPDFPTSRLLYVYYTESGGAANVVAELRAPSGDAVDPASRRQVLRIPHPDAGNHNGGQIAFGPDGLLYVAPGDGARRENAPDLRSLLGKVLRMDPRGGVAGSYTVPADNPYASGAGGARPEIWASGLRNPYRFSFDRATGDLVLGDVGEGTWEEINWLPAASGGGRAADFGWPACEGSFQTGSRSTPCGRAGATLPIIDLSHDSRYISVIPGSVVRDPTLPSLFGRLVYGDFGVAQLRSAIPGLPRAGDDRPIAGVTVGSLASFGEDAGGCVYAASKTGSGAVYRLVETDTRIPCAPAAPPVGPVTPPVGDGGGPAVPPGTTPPPGGGSGGGGGGAGGGGADGAPRPGRLGKVSAQRVLRRGGAVVGVRCRVACRATAAGTLRVGRGAAAGSARSAAASAARGLAPTAVASAARTFPLRRASAAIAAGKTARLRVRLTRRARAALVRALRDGRPASVAIRVRIRPRAGGRSTLLRATVRVKR